MKKVISTILATAAALCSLSASGFADDAVPYGVVLPGGGSVHGSEVFSGSYEQDNNENLILLITPSAQTELLTEEVYNSATAWNNISSHVKVHIYFNSMPSKLPFKKTTPTQVVGSKFDNIYTLGLTSVYNESG